MIALIAYARERFLPSRYEPGGIVFLKSPPRAVSEGVGHAYRDRVNHHCGAFCRRDRRLDRPNDHPQPVGPGRSDRSVDNRRCGAGAQFGAPLTADNIIEVPWASSVIPDGAFTSAADLLKDGRRVVLTPVQKNEPILVSRITGSGQRASLSALIDAGMRAVTLRVDDVRGVAGFVLPGDRVDLVLTRHEGEKSFADVLLQNVKVLAVDQLTNERQEGPAVAKAVTVEVSTEQAQKLILAAGVGSLSLVLRQAGGADPVAARRVSTLDLAQGEYVGMDQEKTNLLQQKLSALEAKMDSELKRLATPPAASPAGKTSLPACLKLPWCGSSVGSGPRNTASITRRNKHSLP